MVSRAPATPRERLETLLALALSDPLAELPHLPLNRAEWQRVHGLYRPIVEDLARRIRKARSAEELEVLERIAIGLVDQYQAELDELRRYLDPPARSEPTGPDSALSGLHAAERALERQIGDELPFEAWGQAAEWYPVTFVGLAHVRTALAHLQNLWPDAVALSELATCLGSSIQASHTSPHQLSQRLLLRALMRELGCPRLLVSSIPARYRPAWDIWSPDLGVCGSVQPDLRLSTLRPFGPFLLWSQLARVDDGLGYLVRWTRLEPPAPSEWLSADLALEQAGPKQQVSVGSSRSRSRSSQRARAAVQLLQAAVEHTLAHSSTSLPPVGHATIS